MDCSMPGFPDLHYLPELAQTQVYWLSDAIQPSQSLLLPSPLALSLSQKQGLFQWVSSLHQVAKVLSAPKVCMHPLFTPSMTFITMKLWEAADIIGAINYNTWTGVWQSLCCRQHEIQSQKIGTGNTRVKSRPCMCNNLSQVWFSMSQKYCLFQHCFQICHRSFS